MNVSKLSASATRVFRALAEKGLPCDIRELSDSTRSAAEAAEAVGCHVSQIAKSLVFKGEHTDQGVLVIASGSNRVDLRKIGCLLGEDLIRMEGAEVNRRTGFAIGGIPPVGHDEKMSCFFDHDLLAFDEIWAAAGTPFAVFPCKPTDLLRITAATVVDLAE